MTMLTLREFAVAVGASISAVQQAAHTGCLRSVTTKGPTGCLYVDGVAAKSAWDSRDQTRSLRARPAPPPPPAPTPARQPDPTPPPAAAVSEPEDEDEDDGEGDSLESATIAQKRAAARLADLRYRREVRELLVASEVATQWAEVASRLRAAMLAVPELLRQARPELRNDDILALDGIVRKTLRSALE